MFRNIHMVKTPLHRPVDFVSGIIVMFRKDAVILSFSIRLPTFLLMAISVAWQASPQLAGGSVFLILQTNS